MTKTVSSCPGRRGQAHVIDNHGWRGKMPPGMRPVATSSILQPSMSAACKQKQQVKTRLKGREVHNDTQTISQ
jgi:hypothetical protein